MTMRSRSEPAVISRLPSRPKASDRGPPARQPVRAGARIRPACAGSSARTIALREIGEAPCPRLSAGSMPLEQPDRNQEALLGGEEPRAVEHVLVASRLAEASLEPLRDPSAPATLAERARVEQRVGDVRPAREDLREPRRGARALSRGDRAARDCCVSSAKSCAPAGSALQQAVEGAHRRVRIAGARERLEQRRRDLGQALARGGRAHRREAPEMPAAHRLRHVLRRLRSRARRSVSSVSGSSSPPVKTRLPRVGRKFVGALEQLRIAPRDRLERAPQLRLEGSRHRASASAARSAPAPRWSRGIVWVCSSRTICSRCSTVAQERHRPRRARRAPPRRSSLSSASCASIARVCRAAQRRIAPAGDQLLRLHEELDLADAAAPALDVVAEHAHRPVPAMRMHLPLDRMDVGDRREVEVFSPDERRELADEGLARRDVAGDGARLDQRGALPVLPHALVVEERRRRRRARRASPPGSGRSLRSMRKT